MANYLRNTFNFQRKKSLLDVNKSSENSPKSPKSLKNSTILQTEKTITADFAFFPSKERKSKYKQHFIVLLASDIYVYCNSKKFQKQKQPKIIINLKNIFNISFYKDSEMIRSQITIMSDVITYFIRLSGTTILFEWYDSLVEKIRVFRSLALQRDIKLNEFFDIAFDCEMSVRPKMKKDYGNQDFDVLDDLYDKITSTNNITSRVRFCMYYNLVVICNIGIQTTCDNYPPFNPKDYIKFSTNVIRDFGKQEKYLFLRIGRCSETGCGELWFKMENTEKAKEAHLRIMELFDSVVERKKSDTRKYSSQNLVVRMPIHRERSFTNPISASSNMSLNIEEKNKRAQTWAEGIEEPKRRVSCSSTANNFNTSSSSKKSSRNLSPAMANIECNNLNLNCKRDENDERCAKKVSVSGLFLKLVDSFNNKVDKNNDNMSYKGSITSIASAVDNLGKISSLVKEDTNTDFCYDEDVRKLSTSAIDSKLQNQISHRFNRLHISPKRQLSFTSTNLSPLIKNNSNVLLGMDYVVMESIDVLNIPLTNSFSNINLLKDSFKQDEVKSYCSDKSYDEFLRSRTNTSVSKNASSPSERSRKNTSSSIKSDIPPNSKNFRINSLGIKFNNSRNNLTISSQFVNNEEYDDECNRKRSYSLGNKIILKQNLQKKKKEGYDSSREFQEHRSRALSLNISRNGNNENIIRDKLKSDDHIEIEFGSTKSLNEQFKLLFSEDKAVELNKSSLDKKKLHPLLIARQEAVSKNRANEFNKRNETNFLFEKTFEISTKLPNTTTDTLAEPNFVSQKIPSSSLNDEKNESSVDYIYETVVERKDKYYTNDVLYVPEFSNHLQNKQTSQKFVNIMQNNDSLKNSSLNLLENPSKAILNDFKKSSLISISSKNDYTCLKQLDTLGKNKEYYDISKNSKIDGNLICDTINLDDDTTLPKNNSPEYCELSY